MLYTCQRCGTYQTKDKSNFNKHLNRKKKCTKKTTKQAKTTKQKTHKDSQMSEKEVKKCATKAEKTHKDSQMCVNIDSIQQQTTQIFEKIQSVESSEEKSIYQIKPTCEFCNKSFSRRNNLTRHQNLYCKKKKSIIQKLQDTVNSLQADRENNPPHEISNVTGTMITNNITINNNTINNTITNNIVINTFGQEDIRHLGMTIFNLLQNFPESAVTDIICERYFDPKHPENKTVKIPSRKEKWAQVYNGQRWDIKRKTSVITDVLQTNFELLDNFYNSVKHKFHPFCDWTEVRKNWQNNQLPSVETLIKTEQILTNQNQCDSVYRKKEKKQ